MKKEHLKVEFDENLIKGNIEFFTVTANRGEDIVIQIAEKKDEKTILCFAQLSIKPEIVKDIIESLQHALEYLKS